MRLSHSLWRRLETHTDSREGDWLMRHLEARFLTDMRWEAVSSAECAAARLAFRILRVLSYVRCEDAISTFHADVIWAYPCRTQRSVMRPD